jgi:hypothetical protein
LKDATLPVPASLEDWANPIDETKKRNDSIRIEPVLKTDKRWEIMASSLEINNQQ